MNEKILMYYIKIISLPISDIVSMFIFFYIKTSYLSNYINNNKVLYLTIKEKTPYYFFNHLTISININIYTLLFFTYKFIFLK